VWRRVKNKWPLLLFLGYVLGVGGFWLPAFAASTTIQTNICSDFIAPVINEPVTGSTDDSSIQVAGTGEPNMTVAIRDNGLTVGTSLIAGDGTFSLQVPLVVGDNVLIARTADNCKTKDSSSVTIHRNAPPEPPAPPKPNTPSSSVPQSNSPLPPVVETPSEGALPQPSLGQPLPPKIPKPTPGYLRPVITEPRNNHIGNAKKIWVGGKAAPFSTVAIYVNYIVVAIVTADENGSFGAMVELQQGENSLQVRANLGKSAAFSDSITTYFRQSIKTTSDWPVMLSVILFWILVLFAILFYIHRRQRKAEYE
jgi:hypothetical protein